MAEVSETSRSASQVTAIGLEVKKTGGMRYRRVGRSGLTVSEMGVGCFSFGEFIDTKAAAAVVHCALGMGINYFDTADSYGIGVSEEKLGAALVGRRDQAIVATKFSNRMDHGANDIAWKRVADAGAVGTDDVALQLVEILARNAGVGEKAHAGVDGVNRVVTGGHCVDVRARGFHAGDGVRGEVDVGASAGDGANVGNR